MTNHTKRPDRADPADLRALLCDLSARLLAWSWEGVVGYEAMVQQVATSYGYDDATVLMEAQSAWIQVDGESTLVKVEIPGVPPLAYTHDLKCLLADIYDGKLSVAEARAAVAELGARRAPNAPLVVWLGVIVLSMGFAVDCVGTWEGVAYAALTAMATGICFIAADRSASFTKVAQLVGTFASGVIVMLAYRYGWTVAAPGLLLIASTFVFIPGDSISMQAFELADGRWSAGVDRLFYSMMTLALQVAGAFLAVVVTGSAIGELFPSAAVETFPWWAVYPGRVVLLIGIMLAFHMRRRHFLPALLVLLAVTAVAQVSSMAWGETAGTLAAAAFGMIASVWLSRRPRAVPTFVLMVPVVFALSPGSHGLRQLETWVSGQPITGVKDLSTLAGILLAIGIGLVIGQTVARRWHWLGNWSTQRRHP